MKISITLEMMVRYPSEGKKEIIKQFKGTNQSELERALKNLIEKVIPEKEYHPKRNFPFIFIYKMDEMQVAFVFYNKWRIMGKHEPEREEILDLTEEDEKYLQKIIEDGE